jgi:hypothetical protein
MSIAQIPYGPISWKGIQHIDIPQIMSQGIIAIRNVFLQILKMIGDEFHLRIQHDHMLRMKGRMHRKHCLFAGRGYNQTYHLGGYQEVYEAHFLPK